MVSIRRLRDSKEDYEMLTKWYHEEEIYTIFEQRILNYDEVKKKYYPRTIDDAKVPVYMIELDNKPVGIIQYTLVNDEDKELYRINGNDIYEMDIFIGELDVHRKGIGSTAINLLSDYLFKEKNANIIVMCPLKTNTRAIKCYEKCGFSIRDYFDTEDTIGEVHTYVLMTKDKTLQ